MPFELAFHPEALREWQQLTAGIREQFKNKLAERLIEPRIPASKLRGSSNRYKIKLRASCCRARLLVMASEAQHLHDPILLKHLVHEPVLDVDAA
jgi:mRNA interferase RelE/StbE